MIKRTCDECGKEMGMQDKTQFISLCIESSSRGGSNYIEITGEIKDSTKVSGILDLCRGCFIGKIKKTLLKLLGV